MPSKRFNLDPLPQPTAPARDRALAASPDGSRELAAARLVPTDLLIADPEQPRRTFTEESLTDLSASLQAQGMRQPITAYYDDSRQRFVVISGERRLRAAGIARLAEVPVLLEHRPTSEGDKLVLQLAENLVREDLTPLEAGAALARLKELRPNDWEGVAARHGINRRRAYQLMERLEDPAPLRAALEQGTIREGHAAEIRRAPAEQQAELLEEVVAHTLSVADTRTLIAGMRDQPPAPGGTAPSEPPQGKAATTTLHPNGSASQTEPPTPTPALPTASGVPATAGQVAAVIAAAAPGLAEQPASRGAALVAAKERRDRSRRLRQRLERISMELRNMHLEEVTAEYTALPEIIVQARQARDSLDAFIGLLERVQLDDAGEMERPG